MIASRVLVAVGVRHRLHHLQIGGVRQRQRRGVVVAGGVGVPDIEALAERHHARRRVDADAEVFGAAHRADDVGTRRRLVQHDRRTRRAANTKRKQTRRHVRTGQNQRIGRAAGAVAAKVRRRRKVVGKVRRHRRKAGRSTVAVLLAAHRPRLVQNQRVRRRDRNNRVRAVVLDLEHARAQVDRRRVVVAVGVRHRLHHLQNGGVRQRQRRGVVVAGGVGVPDIEALAERHNARRRVDADAEVSVPPTVPMMSAPGAAWFSTIDAPAAPPTPSANRPDATFEPVRTSE